MVFVIDRSVLVRFIRVLILFFYWVVYFYFEESNYKSIRILRGDYIFWFLVM